MCLYHILYNAELFLQQQELDDLQDCLGQIGHNLMLARHLADTKCRMSFQVTHKCHWVQHMWHQAILINPRYLQVYGEGSFIGRCTRIWHSCAHGPYQSAVQPTVNLKLLVLLCLELDL